MEKGVPDVDTPVFDEGVEFGEVCRVRKVDDDDVREEDEEPFIVVAV